MIQKQTTPPGKGGAAKSIAEQAIGQSGHSIKALQTQYLADTYSLKRRRAALIAALFYGGPHDVA